MPTIACGHLGNEFLNIDDKGRIYMASGFEVPEEGLEILKKFDT
jgi:predicted alpha/beta hydrolase family esterase